MLKISISLERADRKKQQLTLLLVGGTVKTSVVILRPLQKTRGLALTRKSWSWKCTAKDSYINDTTMASLVPRPPPSFPLLAVW